MPKTTPPTTAKDMEFPQKFGNYTLMRKLARGGMAELFLARKAGSQNLYVIKRILPSLAMDKSFLGMFLTEAKVAAQLNHPNIIQIDALGREGQHIYQAIEYVDGTDLERLLKSCGKIPPDVMAQIAISLCDALCYANRAKDISTGKPLNVVHRDVTPGNVMVTRQGVVKLVDFGVAKATAQLEKTKTGVVKGKFRYMSPEQLQMKELDGRSDLFSVGVLLYEATTGTRPFDRPQIMEIVRALTTWNPDSPAKVEKGYPKAISDVVMKALSKDRDHRYADGLQMKKALEDALSTVPNPQSVQDFIAQYLPPPLVVPPAPAMPAKKAPAIIKSVQPTYLDGDEIEEDDADDEATIMGIPAFRESPSQGAPMREKLSPSIPSRNDAKKKQRVESGACLDDEDYGQDDGIKTVFVRGGDKRRSGSDEKKAKKKKAANNNDAGDEFESWDAPEASMDAPDPDDPRRHNDSDSSKGSPSRQSGVFQGDDDEGSRKNHRRISRSVDLGDVINGGARDKMRKSSETTPRRQTSSFKKRSSDALVSGTTSSSAGTWSKMNHESDTNFPSTAKDKDDSWKVSDPRARKYVRGEGVELSDVLGEEKKADESHTARNIIILAMVIATAVIGLITFDVVRLPGEEGGNATGTGKIVVTSITASSGSVIVGGQSCELPCTLSVSSGLPIEVISGEDLNRKIEVTLQPNETTNLIFESL